MMSSCPNLCVSPGSRPECQMIDPITLHAPCSALKGDDLGGLFLRRELEIGVASF